MVVNPIMSIDEKYHLIHEIQNSSEAPYRKYKMDELLDIIDRYADIKNMEQLGKSLESYLHKSEFSIVKKTRDTNLSCLQS